MKKLVKRKFVVIFCLALGFGLAFSSVVQAQEDQGCSLGFWKQEQHFDFWEGAAPTELFSTYFGSSIEIRLKNKDGGGTTVDPTLLQALRAPGGGINALARQAVAALLNAASPDVYYPIELGMVISLVNGVLADPTEENIEGLKSVFELANEMACPFDSFEIEGEI